MFFEKSGQYKILSNLTSRYDCIESSDVAEDQDVRSCLSYRATFEKADEVENIDEMD